MISANNLRQKEINTTVAQECDIIGRLLEARQTSGFDWLAFQFGADVGIAVIDGVLETLENLEYTVKRISDTITSVYQYKISW